LWHGVQNIEKSEAREYRRTDAAQQVCLYTPYPFRRAVSHLHCRAMDPIPVSFFDRPTLTVARDLVGRHVVREHPSGTRLVGRIVETEGYTQNDPAFHGWNLYDPETGTVRREGRAADLFGPPGTAYVYLIYGMYWLLNVVTEPDGVGGAVLIRAIEPVEGVESMRSRRSVDADVDLTNGPGKLTQALDVDGDQHGIALTESPLYFANGTPVSDDVVATSSRIGLSKGVERPWRFFLDGHRFVSNGTPSDQT
jgi:DNA-3-methyladenine glycosylase